MKTLRGRTVVISGASSGIGQASAEAFARCGARLVLAARGQEALETVARRCLELGAAGAIVVPTDVTVISAVKRLAEQARDFGGGIDVWVSNVGVGAVGRFHETPMSAHEQVIRANLLGHMNDAHAVMPIFIEQGRGIFINVISLGAFASTPFAASYGASKFGLKGFSEALRAEMRDFPGIHICDVYPAFVDTPGIAHGANYVGRRLTAPPPVYDPRAVARAIVRLALHPHNSVTVGAVAHALRLAHLLAPSSTARLAALVIGSYLKRAPRVAPSNGNLFHPPAVAGGIDGGLRARHRRSAPLLAAAGLGLALYLAHRRTA